MISKPSVSVSKLPTAQSQSTAPQRVLFIGGKTSAGSATSGQLYTSLGNSREEDTLFGANSMLAGMIRAAKKVNKLTRFDAIPLDDNGSGTAAQGSVVFSGTATEDGTLIVTIGSSENHSYTLSVADTDTADDIGTALAAAVTADTSAPFTAINTTGSVAITFANKGTEGNACGISLVGSVAGVTVTLNKPASGATDPSLTNIFSVVGDNRYQTIVSPYAYGTDYLADFLDPRFNVTNNILDGVAILSTYDTLANLKSIGTALNSQSLVVFGDKIVSDTYYKGPAHMELGYVVASQIAAIRALRLTQDADISRYTISTTGALDAYGGPALASLPYFNTPLYDMPLAADGKAFLMTEVDELKETGISSYGNNVASDRVILSEVVTTYKLDNASNADTTWKFLNYVDTASQAGEYMFRNLKSEYAQSRLTDGDLVAGRVIANADRITASFVKYYSELSGPDYMIVEAGEDALNYFKENLSVVVDKAAGSVTTSLRIPIVTQLREIVVPMQISFSIA